MPKSEPVNFLSRMIDSMLRTLSDGPPSIEAEDLTQVADSLRSTIKSWRKNPPTAPEREDVVRRVISLQAEVRHGSGVVREEVAIRKPDPREDPDSERPRNPEDDRPTIPPGFDMQAYARRMTAPDTEPPSTKRWPSFEIVVDEARLLDGSSSATLAAVQRLADALEVEPVSLLTPNAAGALPVEDANLPTRPRRPTRRATRAR